ncbi:pyridine nucleotide-disulfide oxidoreductase [Solemya pervernicosa gill symbiont]|uniref:Pyridine nucleotide-disulfide oxidoreductase n=2 Tax=Gammaproteobacteria incertae sedis TaxID=118884 RepID=A0A1T2L849_9GAMM|nr:FAD-dependent oxidoreductase [Candidatus Reidiella endopervernicosa]OOZ41240.1 pyridine nucleotide-disulfide oxidoreductase [Solemya pervernicosa gill symbiont]QKQ25276.1 FAD-dependent oxidoreductase [Candidatus Reidiella endopervernicosa]
MSKRITVIGTGFAAVTAVRELRNRDSSAEITVIGRKAEFVFLPSLIWIPSGMRQGSDLVVGLDNFFRRMRVNFHAGEATGLKDGGRTVVTENGEVENDALLIASGGRFIKKLPGIENAITPCEGIAAAEKIRDRIAEMQGGTIAIGFSGNPKEPSAMRGGPMFEFLFGIDTLLRQQGRRDQFKLVFFTPAPEPGKRLGPKAVKGLLDAMAKRGIETHLGHKMKQFTESKVITEGGEFDANLILFMPGMTGNQWFDNTELARSEGGMLKADALCRVEGSERIYVAGDSGSFPGPEWMPKQAHMADLQAKAAAANIVDELAGRTSNTGFKVELMCIVDSLNSGMLVTRTPKRNLMLPPLRIGHWAKRIFEWWYLRGLR